jgi:predicted permease
MLVLFGAVGLLLLIACVNVTILLIARGARRQGELAMRAALGAGPSRMVRLLLTESLVLAGLGGAFGIVVARVVLAGVVAVSPASLFRLGSIGLDGAALGFALGLTLLVGVVFGLAPAFVRSEGQLHEAGREVGRGSVGRSRSTRWALVVTEVALAMVLLVGAGLLVRSTQRLLSIPPGFDPSSVVVMQVYTTGLQRGDTPTHQFFDQALDAVRNVPGVRSAVLTNQLPLSGDIDEFGVTLDDPTRSEGADGPAYRYAVSPGYFETMGIRLVSGRGLQGEDIVGRTPVAVVSESLAQRLFKGGNPVGNRIRVGPTELPPYTVVGVVEDVKQASLETDQMEAVYVTSQQWHWADRVRWIVVQADQAPLTLVPDVRRAVWSVDRNQPIVRSQSMEGLVARSQAQRRFVLVVLVAFAAFAVTLAAIGLYGVLAGSVAERKREIGVRSALGATRANIMTLVIRQGMTLTAVGVAIGLLVAAAASEALVTLLFGVSRLDVGTYAAVALLLTMVSGVACWIPAARAARVDPLATLRAE